MVFAQADEAVARLVDDELGESKRGPHCRERCHGDLPLAGPHSRLIQRLILCIAKDGRFLVKDGIARTTILVHLGADIEGCRGDVTPHGTLVDAILSDEDAAALLTRAAFHPIQNPIYDRGLGKPERISRDEFAGDGRDPGSIRPDMARQNPVVLDGGRAVLSSGLDTPGALVAPIRGNGEGSRSSKCGHHHSRMLLQRAPQQGPQRRRTGRIGHFRGRWRQGDRRARGPQ